MPLIIAMIVRFIFYLLNHHQFTEITEIRYDLIATSKTFLTPTYCTLYFNRYGFEIYKHHSCQLCLAPLGSYCQYEFDLICTYTVKADWGFITFYSSSRQYLYTPIPVGNLPAIAIN